MASICVANVLGGCAAAMVLTESLSKSGANPMHLVTLVSSIVASLTVLIQDPSILRRRHLPISSYYSIILIFFVVTVINNNTLNFDIPFPLFIIFRSGTLLASVLMSWIMLGRVYSRTQILSVIAVTAGLIWFTLASSHYQPKKEFQVTDLWIDYLPWPRFITGVLAQTLCLFLSAYMGIKQEMLFVRYGKRPDEMLFYVNILSLPLFYFLWPEISTAVSQFNVLRHVQIVGSVTMPLLWVELILACIVQTFCARSVYKLTSVTSTLNVNMILALRKFLSLFLSAYLFANELNLQHLAATGMIIGGSFAYYDVYRGLWEKYLSKYKVKKG